ncbi:hypothetical protein [Halobellus inordinatus]|uniref:hypothetical protein n=1 Tax=Halobellus inordinatus TaxID=1126236 RepID=UPI00210C7E4C|nr:hypothetical protein [Halobellus inordinatus]
MNAVSAIREALGIARDALAIAAVILSYFVIDYAAVPAYCMGPTDSMVCGLMFAETSVLYAVGYGLAVVVALRLSVALCRRYCSYLADFVFVETG